MQKMIQPRDVPLDDKLEILVIARELWSRAGRQLGRLGDFWEAAEQLFIARGDGAIGHLLNGAQPGESLPGDRLAFFQDR